jgi:putative hydrolase of the HAD superfamily
MLRAGEESCQREVQSDAMTIGPQQTLVIFDLDNTLVDRDRFFLEWAETLIRERRLDRESSLLILREADEDGASPRTRFFEQARGPLGLKGPVEHLVEDYWVDQLSRYRCDEETIAGLRLLHRLGHKLGIATNGGARQVDKVKACGLDGLVDAVCVSRMVGYSKPDPRLFAAVAERCRASLEDAWVVGDRPNTDIAGAVAIGARSVWIRRGKKWAEKEFAPTFVAETAADAMRLIAGSDTPVL